MKQFECVQTDNRERWDTRELRAALPRQFTKGRREKRKEGMGQIKAVMGFLQPKVPVVPSGQQLGLTATGDWTAREAKWNNETAHLCPAGVARGE